ncbi:aspartate:alanine exchanger family transporter [Aureispira sp. CCB-QB1]|nr:aspartate:alanine exchanger family transporter [Aureispira sp. CCB-QB1]
MIQILAEYPLLLLFVVASLGYLIGNISIKGNSLGVAAILFTGLFFGAIDAQLQIPEIVLLLGLSIYVYSIGLSSGPAFFESYRKNGIRDFLFIISMLILSGCIAATLWYLFGFSAATITGAYAGSTTNTAALAGVIDYMSNTFPKEQAAELTQELVVGYSFSYPMGVLGGIIAIIVMEKVFRINYEKEKLNLQDHYPLEQELKRISIEVSEVEATHIKLRELLKKHQWKVAFCRIIRDEKMDLISRDTHFLLGDILTVVGNQEELTRLKQVLGKETDSLMVYDRSNFDTTRIFVSNPEVAGRSIASLNLEEKYYAKITRIRRGDVDMLANGDTILELGDRIRFVAQRDDIKKLSKLFGDSYQASSKVNLFSFGLGIGLGLILGTIELNLGSSFSFKLGYAGGPLIVGLILGALRRTGPIVWSLPYSANVTLEQIGLILLLTAIGVRSGNSFIDSFSMEGIYVFGASAVISLLTALSILFVGYKIIKLPFSFLMGMVSNQPAILDFAASRTKNRIPVFGYAMMFPLALIMKIVIAQVLFLVLH